MSYYGDYVVDSTDFSLKFTSRNTTGQPHALLSGDIDIYRNNNTTPTTAGVTLTSTFASVVGLNYVQIDLSNTTFYSSGNEYTIVLSGGTVNSVAVTGEVIGEFSIENRFTTGVSTADLDDALNVFGASTVTTGDLDSALTNYGGTTLSSTEFVDANTTALETYGASTHTSTDVFDQSKNAITTLSVASTGDLDSALSNYGASTLGSTELKDVTTTALEDYGASTHTTTDVFDQAKNAISTLSVASTADLATALNTYGASTMSLTQITSGVWEEILTGGTHNLSNSAGRRLRIIQEAGSYTNGTVFIDTVGGTAGTVNFENGVDILPSDTIANANTLATSVGLSRFRITPGSSFTFAASQENEEFDGQNWILALGGQSVSGSHFLGADVSGTGTGAGEIHFEHCEIGDITIAGAHFDMCDLSGTITLSAADTYVFVNCTHSGGTIIIDFGGAVGNTTVHMHGQTGPVTIANLGANGTDILHYDSPGGQLTLAASCVGGTVNIRGVAELINNGSSITINRGGDVINDVSNVPTVAEFEARTPTAAQLLYMTRHSAQAIPWTATGGSTSTIIFDQVDGAAASTRDDAYNNRVVVFDDGILANQVAEITDYAGATVTATISEVTNAVTSTHTGIVV